VELCRERGAKVFSRKLDGFGSQNSTLGALFRRLGLLHRCRRTRFRQSWPGKIADLLGQSDGLAGYDVPRRMYFLGSACDSEASARTASCAFFAGPGPLRPLEIHEQVEVDGAVGLLHGALDHYSYATLDEYQEKLPVYTAMAPKRVWKPESAFIGGTIQPAWELFSRVV